MTKEEAKAGIAEICEDLGCSGLSKSCPGDANCSILRKIVRPQDYEKKNETASFHKD